MNSMKEMNDYCNSIFTIPIDSHFYPEQLKSYGFSLADSPTSTTISSLSLTGEEDFSKVLNCNTRTIQFTNLLIKSFRTAIQQQKLTYLHEVRKALLDGLLF